MSRQLSHNQLLDSDSFKDSEAEYQDDLEFLEQEDEDDLEFLGDYDYNRSTRDELRFLEEDSYCDGLTLDTRHYQGLQDDDMDGYGSQRSQPSWRKTAPNAATRWRSQSRQPISRSISRNTLRPVSSLSRLHYRLKVIFASEWAVFVALAALALYMSQVSGTSIFWHPSTRESPLSKISSAATGNVTDHYHSVLMHQLCKLPLVTTLLHCPQPEQLLKQKRVHKDKWSKIFWTIEDQHNHVVWKRLILNSKYGWKMADHSHNLAVLIRSHNDRLDVHKGSINRKFETLLRVYDQLPVQQSFGFVQRHSWPSFVRDLASSYNDARSDVKMMGESFEKIGKKVDELLKFLLEIPANERIHIWPVQKEPTWTDTIKSLFGYPQEEIEAEVDMEKHDYVINLREIQPLITEVLQGYVEYHAALFMRELHLRNDLTIGSHTTWGTRPKYVQDIMEGARKSIQQNGSVELPTLVVDL